MKYSKWLLVPLLLVSNASFAQKIGYANMAQVFQAHPQRAIVMQQLQEDFRDQTAEIQALRQKFQTMLDSFQRDQALLSNAERESKQRELGQLDAELKTKIQRFERMSAERESKEQAKLLNLIRKEIDIVAKENNYDLIIDLPALLYINAEYDLTSKIIKRLK